MAVEPGSSFLVVLPPASPRVCTRPLRLRTSGGALAPSHSWNPTPLPLCLGCLPSLPPLSLLPARENSLLFRVHAISSHPLRQSEIIFPPQGPKHLQGRCFCLKDHSHSFQGLQRRHFGEPSCLPHPSQSVPPAGCSPRKSRSRPFFLCILPLPFQSMGKSCPLQNAPLR